MYLIFKIARQSYNIAEAAVIALFTIAQGVLNQTFIYFIFGWIYSGPFLRTVESISLMLLILYATYVMFQLLAPLQNKIAKTLVATFTGVGLLAIWLGSAYVLYWMLE